MISIEQWRARIGLFNCKRCSGFSSSFFLPFSRHRQRRPAWNVVRWLRTQSLLSVNVDSGSFGFCLLPIKDHLLTSTCLPECSFSSVSTGSSGSTSSVFSLRRSLLRDTLIILLIAITSQQLIISGDIETNPGPTRKNIFQYLSMS